MIWTEADVRNLIAKDGKKGSRALAALSEAHVTRQIKGFLEAEKWMLIRLNAGLFQRPNSSARIRIGTAGMSDWLALRAMQMPIPGTVQAMFLEIKSQSGVLSAQQEQWMEAQMENGFVCEWFQSFDAFKVFYKDVFGDWKP